MGKETKRNGEQPNGELREMVTSAVRFVKESGYRFKPLGMLDEVVGLVKTRNGDDTVSSQELVSSAVGEILEEIGQANDFRPEFYVWNHERGELEVKLVKVSR